MSAVGFEPTPYYGTAPKAAALDHSAKLTHRNKLKHRNLNYICTI